jgi:indolepyruvate ferredoxin oxidoreductase beta subunit
MSDLPLKAPADAPITLLLCALGGEGGGVLADWLVDTALHCGHAVQATSIPGVAQRTGATTYYVEIHPRPLAEMGGRRPVFGLYAVPGALDLLVGSELLELARQAVNGMVAPERTAVIASSSRTLTTGEKMGLGDGRVPSERLIEVLRRSARELELHDLGALAAQGGTVISAVMFGAIAGWLIASGRLPFGREAYEATIRRAGVGVEASLRGFGLACDRVLASRRQRDTLLALADDVGRGLAAAAPSSAGPPALPAAVLEAFPVEAHALIALGHARLLDYQDAAYAQLYLERLQRVAAAAGGGRDAGSVVAETARWLALWMAYDDVVRVADLKSRASRFERLRREVKAQEGELLKVFEHFKPGVAELAALLPSRWAARVRRWEASRIAAGKPAFERALQIGSHTVGGLLALRLLAGLKRWRRHGSRWADEQSRIEQWLAGVTAACGRSAELGREVARCGRLIKGYGSTHERGQRHLLHLLEHVVARGSDATVGAQVTALRTLREAALADGGGLALDRALLAHGVPPRPVPELPIRWVRRSSGPR